MAFRFNIFTGNLDQVGSSGSGSGDVTGTPPSDDKAITRYLGTSGLIIQNSPGTRVQDSGAIEAQGFITNRTISGTTTVSSSETWIAPSLEMTPGSIIQLASGAQLIII